MILFNNIGPCLFFVSDYYYWYPLGYSDTTPQVKFIDKYQPISSPSTGEHHAVSYDETFEGRDVYIDVTFNLFDERLMGFTNAAPRWNLFTSLNAPVNVAMPVQASVNGGANVQNAPVPASNFQANGNRQQGIFDRRDFGSLMSEQMASYPVCIFNLKFNSSYPDYQIGRPLGNRCPPPGYTFFQMRPKTVVEVNISHSPNAKRFIFQAINHSVDFPNQSIFRTWNRKKINQYPLALLDISNYYIDNSYTNLLPNLGAIAGGQALYFPGIPKGLKPVDPSSYFHN